MSGNPLLDALEDILNEPIEAKSENEPQESEKKEEKKEAQKEDTCEKGTCPIPKVKPKRKSSYVGYWKCRECSKEGDFKTPFCSQACKKKAIAKTKRELERLRGL